MDQRKTGQFIKALRQEQGLTQKMLAEQLNVSEKTVSKWETGKGFPDVGLILPLTKAMGISVNELLSGERLNEQQYVTQAEENLSALLEDQCSSVTKNTVASISLFLTLIASVGSIVICAGVSEVAAWSRIVLIVCAALSVIANISLIDVLGISSEIFECPECGVKFAAKPASYVFGLHTMTKRRLRCPYCGKKSWCRSSWRK